MDEEGNFRNEEGNAGIQLFISNGPWHLKRHNKWMGDTWHVSRSGKSTWFPTNKAMTRGTNSLAKRPEEVTFLWTTHGQGGNWWYQKTNSILVHNGSSWSMTVARGSQFEQISSMSKTGRTRLEIISSWADNAQPTLLFWHEHYTPVLELTKLMWIVVNDG